MGLHPHIEPGLTWGPARLGESPFSWGGRTRDSLASQQPRHLSSPCVPTRPWGKVPPVLFVSTSRGKQNHHLSHRDLRGVGASTLLPGCTVGLFLGRPHRGAKSGHRQELPANTQLHRALPAPGAVTVGGGHLPNPFPSLAPSPLHPCPDPWATPAPLTLLFWICSFLLRSRSKTLSQKALHPLSTHGRIFPSFTLPSEWGKLRHGSKAGAAGVRIKPVLGGNGGRAGG